MSPHANGQPAGWDGVTAVLEKIHAGGETFEQFLHRQLDELESLRVEMEQHERCLEEERCKLRQAQRQFELQGQSLEDQRLALARDLEQMRTETEHLSRSKAELEHAAAELTRLREQSAAESGAADEALLAQLAAAETQHSALEQELAAARAQIARLADTTAELAEVRAELLRVPERLAAEAEAAKQELRVRIADLEAERAALDHELAEARAAATAMADAVCERDAIRQELARTQAELHQRDAANEASGDAARTEMQSRLAELEVSRQQLHDRVALLEAERSGLDQELAEARFRAERLVEAENERDAARRELAEAQVELVRRDAAGDGAAVAAELLTSGEPDERIRILERELAEARRALQARSDEFTALERQVREMDNERSLLETELETVRHRTVELAETAAAERQRMAEERNNWSRELKQLRKSGERPQPAPSGAVPHAASVSTTQPAGVPLVPAAATATIDGDPMLESVMAQFDMLQKDIARRRTNGKKSR